MPLQLGPTPASCVFFGFLPGIPTTTATGSGKAPRPTGLTAGTGTRDGKTRIGIVTNGLWHLDFNNDGMWNGTRANVFTASAKPPTGPRWAAGKSERFVYNAPNF